MKTAFKYSGGKSRELKKIRPFIPENTKRIVEPFCGSCAVAFDAELPSLVCDINDDVINLLLNIKNLTSFEKIVNKVNDLKLIEDQKELETIYYYNRDDLWKSEDKLKQAFRFLVLRQLCFSGMNRFNPKTGKFNVPFGWYKKFATNLSVDHHNLLQNWEIKKQSFIETLSEVREHDWVFLDPPYYKRQSDYGNQDDSLSLHNSIFQNLKNIQQPWLLVHVDCELYRDLYSDYKIYENGYTYSQNFKGRENKNSKVKHLYIVNH